MNFKNLLKQAKPIFIPAWILILIFSFSSSSFWHAKNLLFKEGLKLSSGPTLMVGVMFFQILLALLIWYYSKKTPLHLLLSKTLYLLGLLVTFFSVCFFFQKNLAFSEANLFLERFLSKNLTATYTPLLTNWPTSFLFMILHLTNSQLFFFFIYSFINSAISSEDGIKYYIPLVFIFTISSGVIKFSYDAILKLMPSAQTFPLSIAGVVFLIAGVFFFNKTLKKAPQDSSTSIKTHDKLSPFLLGSIFLAAPVVLTTVLGVVLKFKLRQTSTTSLAAIETVGSYSVLIGAATLVMSILWAGFGTWSLKKQGVRQTIKYCSGFLAALSALFLIAYIPSKTYLWMYQGAFLGGLMGTKQQFMFPLLQIMYLCLPQNLRFHMKATTELILAPLMIGSGSILMQMLIIAKGSLPFSISSLQTFSLFCLAALLFSSYRLSKTFNK